MTQTTGFDPGTDTYECTVCWALCDYAEVHNTGRCPACGSGVARRQPAARRTEPEGITELRQEVRALRRTHPARQRGSGRPSSRVAVRSRRSRGRARLALAAAAITVILVVILTTQGGGAGSFPAPSRSALAGLSVGARIVAIAQSQVGYSTDPANSYCNKFSAYWDAGSSDCSGGMLSEEWCADFAAWAWRQAGLQFPYGYEPGDINASAASFYTWAVANGRWHPATSGYVAQPGDVAVYGLSLGSVPTAAHVAIVTSDSSGQRGPDAINGDGDRTGFSVVESVNDETSADTDHRGDALLAGYASPPA